MYNIDDILERIKFIEGVERDSELIDILNVSQQVISAWRRRNTIPHHILIEYCIKRNLSTDWVFFGKTNNQSLKKALGQTDDSPGQYQDPKDEIIMRLEAENRRLRQICDSIRSIIIVDDKAPPGRRSGHK